MKKHRDEEISEIVDCVLAIAHVTETTPQEIISCLEGTAWDEELGNYILFCIENR